MARKRIPGTFSVETSPTGTPMVRGTATVDGKRRRKSQTFPTPAAAHAMAEALTKAARLGDYAWFSDPSWSPQPYLDGSIEGRQVALPRPAPEPHQPARAYPRRTRGWTVDEWLADGCRERILAGQGRATRANYSSQLDAVALAFRGQDLAVVARTPGKDLAKLLSKKLEPVSPDEERRFTKESVEVRTTKDRIQRLKDVFRDAYANDVLSRAPAILVDGFQLRSGKKLVKWLMLDDMQALHKVLQSPQDDVERVAFLLTEACMFTGLRFSEVSAFRWKETLSGVEDFVPIEWTWDRRGKALKGTKADGAQWQIPYTTQLEKVIKRVRKHSSRERGFVFATEASSDRPMLYEHWRKSFRKAIERAELDIPRGYSQKIFRNSFIVWGKVCGVPLGFMQAQYGHTTTRMIQQTYDGQISMKKMPKDAERKKMRSFLGFDQLEKKRKQI